MGRSWSASTTAMSHVSPMVSVMVSHMHVGNGTTAERQAWFLDQIRNFQLVGVKELASHFGVTRRTAERDIADLTRRGLVTFVGRTRTGRYRLPGQDD